ncbi:hypothetical protein FB566_1017 [Stackebrandtia endophytica]|uniref:Uncharacterized protein n=1 Tax=Stackebrandtia endophytica TaxID=1496996 RepID=A0A543ASE9_9ACTN|nr:hypothetical protein [Stackebrandtia endophytica]TQL75511.1 hypothetical protein FB566_1017 [Stackebrandtia endophytica]
MSSADYERLLSELAAELTANGLPRGGRTALDPQLSALDDRLLAHQADLLHSCPKLGIAPPKLTAIAPTTPPPDAGAAIRQAHRHLDTATSSLMQAMRWATMPRFLPKARIRTRHLAVYALCAVVAVAVHAMVILQNGVIGAALGFAVAPLSAFAVAYLLIGRLGRPWIRTTTKPVKLNRYPKYGLILCVAIDLVAALAWLTTGG